LLDIEELVAVLNKNKNKLIYYFMKA